MRGRLVFAREPLEYGEHDDLVIALALAAWFVRAREPEADAPGRKTFTRVFPPRLVTRPFVSLPCLQASAPFERARYGGTSTLLSLGRPGSLAALDRPNPSAPNNRFAVGRERLGQFRGTGGGVAFSEWAAASPPVSIRVPFASEPRSHALLL